MHDEFLTHVLEYMYPIVNAVAVQNSPLAEGKKRLARLQAGDYEVSTVQELIDETIQKNPVVMFSFGT